MGVVENRWCVVTGGRGFTARHLVEMLIRDTTYSVRIADLGPTIELEPSEQSGVLGQALTSGRAQYVSLDLRDKYQRWKELRLCSTRRRRAPSAVSNNYQLHYSVNVQGTQNVIDACVELKVKRLIYTSSGSVVSDGVQAIHNGNESMPFSQNHNDHYSATKALADALVLNANGRNGLLTCCLRPSSIFGPGNKLLVPWMVAAAKAGAAKFTYVDNVAYAHICADRALASEGPVSVRAAGEAYFITNAEPMRYWDFSSAVLEGLGYERPRIKIPFFVVMAIAYLMEWICWLLGPYGMKTPKLSPSILRNITCSRTFDCSKAKDRLGYSPIISLQEGLRRTIESYSHLRAENQGLKGT